MDFFKGNPEEPLGNAYVYALDSTGRVTARQLTMKGTDGSANIANCYRHIIPLAQLVSVLHDAGVFIREPTLPAIEDIECQHHDVIFAGHHGDHEGALSAVHTTLTQYLALVHDNATLQTYGTTPLTRFRERFVDDYVQPLMNAQKEKLHTSELEQRYLDYTKDYPIQADINGLLHSIKTDRPEIAALYLTKIIAVKNDDYKSVNYIKTRIEELL